MVVYMSDELDKILNDIEAEKQAKLLHADGQTAEKLAQERRDKVSGFKLQLDLDEESAEPQAAAGWSGAGGEPADEIKEASGAEPGDAAESVPVVQDEKEDEAGTEPKSKARAAKPDKSSSAGCFRGIVYAVLVLAVSGVLAYFGIVGGLDMTGLFKSDLKVPVTLTKDQIKDTGEVARVLHEAGVIDQPMIFSLYCRLTGANKDFQPQDEASVSPDMGYKAIINILRTKKREIVRVTFPEGMTIEKIARKLEDNRVCSVSDFYMAMKKGKFNYDFLNEIPEGEAYRERFERFEGYIFPDSYDFYVGSSGETALRKFFDAFNNRIDVTMRAKIRAKGMTLNDTIILASIIQWEAGKVDDMDRVSRVLHNRLNKPGTFPRLECDSTLRYIDIMTPPVNGKRVENVYYNTYKRNGLPIGAICNPGLDAIEAALEPTNDKYYKDCYYFATDMDTGETHFSKTLAEHERWCRIHEVGLYKNKNK